jgi:hypothetical protein
MIGEAGELHGQRLESRGRGGEREDLWARERLHVDAGVEDLDLLEPDPEAVLRIHEDAHSVGGHARERHLVEIGKRTFRAAVPQMFTQPEPSWYCTR